MWLLSADASADASADMSGECIEAAISSSNSNYVPRPEPDPLFQVEAIKVFVYNFNPIRGVHGQWLEYNRNQSK